MALKKNFKVFQKEKKWKNIMMIYIYFKTMELFVILIINSEFICTDKLEFLLSTKANININLIGIKQMLRVKINRLIHITWNGNKSWIETYFKQK